MAYSYTGCPVVEVIRVTDTIKRFVIRKPEGGMPFRAGQFVMLDLPIDSRVTNRSYSIASPPSDPETFELVISENPEGLGTRYLFHEVAVGTVLQVSMPLGKFVLPDAIDRDLCFICTGTGVAPFRSQLLDLLQRGVTHRNLYLVFGTRWEKDLLYRREFEALQERHPGFRYVPVLSRNNAGWTGQRGYVHEVYETIFSDHRPAWFYLCGWAAMLNEARLRLSAMGYDKDDIRFEKYD
jgi:ferredoxin-NADP reductase